MSMEWIRKHYNVPAKRGMEVIAEMRHGAIVGSKGEYLRVRIDGEKNIMSFHPGHEMKYIIEPDQKKAYFGMEHADADHGYGIVAESISEAKKLLFNCCDGEGEWNWIDMRINARPNVNVENMKIGIVDDIRLALVMGFCSGITEFECDICETVSYVELFNNKVVCGTCYDRLVNANRKERNQ